MENNDIFPRFIAISSVKEKFPVVFVHIYVQIIPAANIQCLNCLLLKTFNLSKFSPVFYFENLSNKVSFQKC